jgi:putative PIN family toxin of toxin-antitoxin system
MDYWVVLDTNILIAALRSRRGASYRLLMLVGTGAFDIAISVPLVLEYEATAKRVVETDCWMEQDTEAVIDYICSVAKHQQIFYLWRPFLRDAKDDMVLELAIAAECDAIITYNKADFRGVERFGIRVMDAREFLAELGR